MNIPPHAEAKRLKLYVADRGIVPVNINEPSIAFLAVIEKVDELIHNTKIIIPQC